ncbi:glycosyltransferase family 2 protein [Azotosporobacter soli]|uniref:glycosyltransferase family 2 protein n=1 Tax=Azotosporobacter soli TaxID=3055040 RepID=UPI0031FF0226
MNPDISVIVPIYKVEAHVRKCIESILAQSFTNIEIILVDDGSPDNSGDICDEYARKDPRVRVIHKENRGVSSARNVGVDMACGRYIGFVDGDDWVEPDMYLTLHEAMREYDADIAHCTHRNVKLTDSIQCAEPENSNCDGGIQVYSREEALLELLNNIKITNLSGDKLYKAELFDGIIYPEGQTYEDWYTVPKLLACAKRIVKVRKIQYYYLRHLNGITGTLNISKRYDFFCAVRERARFIKVNYPQLAAPYAADFIKISLMLCYDLKKADSINSNVCVKEIQDCLREYLPAGLLNKELPLHCKGYLILLGLNMNLYAACKTVIQKIRGGSTNVISV